MSSGDKAEHILYKVYWRLCLSDILNHLGFEPTARNKELLHDFHKRILGYNTTAGRTHEVMSRFVSEVCIFWAVEKGIFVRTSKRQPENIEMMDLLDTVTINGKEYQVWDLL